MITRRAVVAGLVGGAALLWSGRVKAEPCAQPLARIAGTWTGVLSLGNHSVRLRFQIAADGDVVLYNVEGARRPTPARVRALDAERIEIAVPAVQGAFRGRFAGADRIEGVWDQGVALALALLRGEAGLVATAPPLEPLRQSQLEALRERCGAPALAAAALRGRPAQLWVTGERALGSGVAASADDRWHLGSITKSMTATLVARLVEAGALGWETTLGELLGKAVPRMQPVYREATLLHLLSHRSGIPGNLPDEAFERFSHECEDPRAERLQWARLALALPPLGPLGSAFGYSNNGYVVLGAALEARLGRSWEALMRAELFEPLGLASAGFGVPGRAGALQQPVGHAFEGGAVQPLPVGSPLSDNPAALGPAGRVHMGLADLVRYAGAHRDRERLLCEKSWERLHTPPFGGSYALGWEVRRDGSLWHNGSNTFWYAELAFDRASGAVAAAAANAQRPGVDRAVGEALQRALLAA